MNVLDTPIALFPVGARTFRCLYNEGYETLRDVLARPSGTWHRVYSFGPASLAQLREVVAFYGYTLDDDEPRPQPPTVEQLRQRMSPHQLSQRDRDIVAALERGEILRTVSKRHGISRERVRAIGAKHRSYLKWYAAFEAHLAELQREGLVS